MAAIPAIPLGWPTAHFVICQYPCWPSDWCAEMPPGMAADHEVAPRGYPKPVPGVRAYHECLRDRLSLLWGVLREDEHAVGANVNAGCGG
jgi:hypothetical protein